MIDPEVSVVIRAYNEEAHLPGLLAALRKQSLQSHEVVVVDSGSTDQTRMIAETADQLITIKSRDFTFGYSLNVGIRNARGRYIAIVSAHTLPVDRDWLANLVAPLRHGAAMVFGRQFGMPGVSKFSETQDLRRTFTSHRKVLEPPNFFANNANAAICKDLWAARPFDEALPGLEDAAWARYWVTQGRHVVYEPSAGVYHIHQEAWPQVSHRYYREAVAHRRLELYGPADLPRVFAREAICLLSDAFLAFGPDAASVAGLSLPARLHQIGRFRWHKFVGTFRGLMDGHPMENEMDRRTFYFNQEYTAVAVIGKGKARVVHRQIPEVKPGDVLIRVAYVGVCGTDLEILDGTLGYYSEGIAAYPIVPGHEMSGVAVAVGGRVHGLNEGDRVVVECIQSCGDCEHCNNDNPIACDQRRELGVIGRDGGYSEYVLVEDRFVHRIPDALDLRSAALSEPLAVALKGVERLERAWPALPTSKRCAVVGGGPLGHLCSLVLQDRGHHVTVIDRNPVRRNLFEDTGIETRAPGGKLHDFDILVEVTGDPEALHGMIRNSRPGATMLLLGLPYSHRTFSFEDIVAYDKIIVGSVGSSGHEFRGALALLPRLRLQPFLQSLHPLVEFEKAWEEAREGRFLKSMLEVAPEDSARRDTTRVERGEGPIPIGSTDRSQS